MLWAILILLILALLATVARAGMRLQSRSGRMRVYAPDAYTTADRYADIGVAGRTDQEVLRANDPSRAMGDFEAGPNPYWVGRPNESE